jgi:hypothetical protein
MKAQILKIAGVKTEAEFYKKFPSEEAFMKKHGKQLEKAQNGIKKKFTTPEVTFKPISGATSPIFDYYNNSNDENSMLTTPYQMGKLSNVTTGETTTLAPMSNSRLAGNMLLNQAGSIIGLSQSIADKYGRQTDELNNYEKFSKMIAGMPAPTMPKPKYVRPEYSQVSDPQKYGIPMAEDGATIGGNPTEIQNIYNPYDIYTDLGYEPLNDSNVKQYQFGGGVVANSPAAAVGGGATGGFNASQFMGAAGSLGGALGSSFGGDDFAQTEEGQLGSTLGGALGTAIGGPVGGLIGSGLGGIAGGVIGGKKNRQMKFQKQTLENNLTAGAFTNALQNGPLSSYAEDGATIPSYEEGGWMNPEYNPQVIAKFGDYSMDQLLAPPHDADMLRSGGHLAQVNYTPPSAQAMYTGRNQMEHGGQMAMGGELQVHRGQAETLSYNPFLPNNGETVMFRGPSHSNGGMPISYGQNGVEVEGGEPAQVMQDGGETDGNLVVFGNMVIPEYGVTELGDKDAKGKKFKHYIADLSKLEAKQNKLLEKTTSLVDDVDVNDQFDKLSLNTGQANLIGATMKLKNIAEKKKTAAAVQNAILDTASEMGVESDALAKGKIKYAKANDPYAKFGAKLQKGGKVAKTVKYDPEFENFIDQAMMLEQANSSQQITPNEMKTPIGGEFRGGGTNFGTNNPSITTREKAKEYYYKNYWSKVKDLPAGLRTRALQLAINTGDPYGELMVASGKMSVADRAATKDQRKDKAITGNKDWEKSKADILKAYKEDPQAFLGKLDSEQNRYYDSIIANKPSDVNSDTRKEFFDDYTGLARYASQSYINNPLTGMPAATGAGATKATIPTTPAPAMDYKKFMTIPFPERKKMAIANGIKGFRGLAAQNQNLFGIVNKPKPIPPASSFLPTDPTIDDSGYAPLNQKIDLRRALMPEAYGNFDMDTDEQTKAQNNVNALNTNVTPIVDDKKKQQRPSAWNNVLTGINSVIPFLRPTNQMSLDPSQLSGEMLALATNQVEPVYAQSYQPNLAQPYAISLQDMRNQITSESRGAQRLAQGNPAAAAMIAAQAAEAKNKVNADEFRANQGEQARVAELNRQTLNDAQMKNLAIFQDQAGKMSQARSNTKQQSIVALNSINDKILKNKLENRTLGITENLYNYRFSPNGVAYNVNPAAQFAPYGSGAATKGAAGQLKPGKKFSFDENQQIIGTYNVDKDDAVAAKNGKSIKSVNGSIVKAIKNL